MARNGRDSNLGQKKRHSGEGSRRWTPFNGGQKKRHHGKPSAEGHDKRSGSRK